VAYLREIITDGHPTLRKVAKRVEPSEIQERLFQQLLDDMFETMYDAPGIGLAAPQINISKRVFVVDLQDDEREHGPLVVVNPKFTVTEGEIESIEGCLSVPGMIGDLARFERVVCSGLDRRGRKIELEGTGLFGRCLQHEMDHLDGILYIDKAKNVRPAVTEEEKAALEKAQAEGEAAERSSARSTASTGSASTSSASTSSASTSSASTSSASA
jgi:peptide deformylase